MGVWFQVWSLRLHTVPTPLQAGINFLLKEPGWCGRPVPTAAQAHPPVSSTRVPGPQLRADRSSGRVGRWGGALPGDVNPGDRVGLPVP